MGTVFKFPFFKINNVFQILAFLDEPTCKHILLKIYCKLFCNHSELLRVKYNSVYSTDNHYKMVNCLMFDESEQLDGLIGSYLTPFNLVVRPSIWPAKPLWARRALFVQSSAGAGKKPLLQGG